MNFSVPAPPQVQRAETPTGVIFDLDAKQLRPGLFSNDPAQLGHDVLPPARAGLIIVAECLVEEAGEQHTVAGCLAGVPWRKRYAYLVCTGHAAFRVSIIGNRA